MKFSISTNKVLLLFLLLLLLSSLVRSFPFTATIFDLVEGVDDWNRYARQALDIEQNGLSISSITGDYNGPGGFLYNYFLAALLGIFGPHLFPIYAVQSMMLGLSVAFVFWTFKNSMNRRTGNLFLVTLCGFALLDVHVHYTHALLSENLGLLTISAFLYFLVRTLKSSRKWQLYLATVFLVLAILSRPNFLPFSGIYVLVLLYRWRGSNALQKVLPHIIILLAGLAIIPFRNYLVGGNFTVLPSEGTHDALVQLYTNGPLYFLKKVAYCFGYLSALMPDYRIRPHWMLMWCGYFVHCFYWAKYQRKPALWELTSQAFIVTYFVLAIVFVTVGSYGYRAFIPFNFIVLAFAFTGLDTFLANKGRRGST